MIKAIGIFLLFFLTQAAMAQATIDLNELKVFPSATGYGRFSGVKQPARTIRYVENLHNSGPGSLRAAVTQPNSDVVFYGLAGSIQVNSLLATAGNVRIHGQTGNIAIVSKQPYLVRGAIFRLAHNNSMVRHLRIRRKGEEVGWNSGGGGFLGGNNYMFDHITYSWMSDDMTGAAYNGGSNATYQNCMFYTTLPKIGKKRGTGKGTLFYNDLRTLSMKNNVWAHVGSRSPVFKAYKLECKFEMLNNVIYNFSSQGGHVSVGKGGDDPTPASQLTGSVLFNMIGNKYITGPNKYAGRYAMEISKNVQVYLKDNLGQHRTSTSQPEFDLIGGGGISDGDPSKEVFTPFDMNYTIEDAVPLNDLEDYVLARCGPYIFRDVADAEIVNDIKTRTGETYDPANPTVFVYPTLTSTVNVTDTNANGIDDTFDAEHGLTGDGTGTTVFWDFETYQVNNYAGYTDREMYWAWLANDFKDL